MDRFIKHNPGPQARKQQALQWLEQLRSSDMAAWAG